MREATLTMMRALLGALCSFMPASFLLTGSVAAQEEDAALKPQVMREPGHVVDVMDAFDDDNGDPFDISVGLGFEYMSKRARILRESSVFAPGLTTGGYTVKLQNVGRYIETTSKLTPRVDIGVFEDLAVFARIPIILANSRRIDPIDGSDANVASVLQGAPGEVLFTLPFEAPDRSGVEFVAVGADFGIFNQARDRTKPTWVIGFETRIRAGEEMHPCNENPASGQVKCAHEGDVDRNGQTNPDPAAFEAVDAEEQSPGVTRGTVGLEIHTLMSKRLKYIEPYGGFNALFEFRQGGSGFNITDLDGALVNHPPYVGTVLVGMMVHPWENREAFQRITLDVRFQGEYHSEGRDYGELFDALGSSSARSLRTPKWARFTGNPDWVEGDPNSPPRSVVDQGSERIYYTGLSVIEAHGSYRASGSVTWRAGQYVRIQSGLALRFDQAHGITHDQPCNPDFNDNPDVSGPCHSGPAGGEVATGIPNPAYRPSVNAIGRRFYVDESITYEVFASGLVMF